ncbi:uncharacterized protein LOC110850454 [Folsomia candida]|uniref:uncharacterized protein LOC110850454 n=1 Tax=Folsomia candida TaxID=158441 RepID=UPI000B902997|nr:uncharacterized protein LOC110850454 [Folsomia candida]
MTKAVGIQFVTGLFFPLTILIAGTFGQQYFDGGGNTPNSQHQEECSLTNCDSYSKCPHGWMELYTERYTCSGGKEKKYCCFPGRTPLCYHTPCSGPSPTCLNGYREWSRSTSQCWRNDEIKLHCCIDGHLPQCFNTTCSGAGDLSNQCPGGYGQVAYWKGAGWECPAHLEMRTCCRTGDDTRQNQNPFNTQQRNNPFSNNQQNYDRNYPQNNNYPSQNSNFNQQQNYQGSSDFRDSCQYTNCETYPPRCPVTHSQELSTDKSYCTQGRERRLCCRPGQLPPCYDTSCESGTNLRCPNGYREWSRDTVGCGGSNEQKLHCCAEGQYPTCFNTTCADNPTCPAGFLEGNSRSGERQNECGWRMSRKTCCRSGNDQFAGRDGLSSQGGFYDQQQQSRGTPEGCIFSDCQQYARCPLSYTEMFTDRKTCPSGRERNMCCRQDLLPQCIETLCDSTYSVQCPYGYREQSRGNQGCSSSLDTKLYCCSDSRQQGHCYNTTCTNSGQTECRRGYAATARGKGVEWGCPWTAYKSTCCETGSWNGEPSFGPNIVTMIAILFGARFLPGCV